MEKFIFMAALLLITMLGCAPSIEVNCQSDGECEDNQTCAAGKCVLANNQDQGTLPDGTTPDSTTVVDIGMVSDAHTIIDGATLPQDSSLASDAADVLISSDMNIDEDAAADGMNPIDAVTRADAFTPVSDAFIAVLDAADQNNDAVLPVDAMTPDSALPPSPDVGSNCETAPAEGDNISDNGCDVGVGACQGFGHYICEDNIILCDAIPGNPSEEICDGIDNDCDGETDEDFPDLGIECGEGIGACISSGVFVCNQADTSSVICSAEVLSPSGESCDGVDNNCDGTIDENYDIDSECSVGTGACERNGNTECRPDGQGTMCNVSSGPPSIEACNSIDDDCNGLTDDGLHLGENCSVGRGACEVQGQVVCKNDGLTECNATPGNPSEEICDGIDNDCDGNVDEDENDSPLTRSCYSGAPETAGIGVCSAGTETCVNGIFGACTGETTPTGETCNGADDDCNGSIDNDIPGIGTVCLTGLPGICSTGHTICNADNQLICLPESEAGELEEVCDNGRDEDCNGVTDDGFLCACLPLSQQDCYDGPVDTRDVGLCHNGRQTCSIDGTTFSACEDQVTPVPEICDDFDNDCDGNVDEETGKGSACTVGVGACVRNGVMVCAPNGGTTCNAVEGTPTNELCNDLDDDCDGSIDEANAGGPLTQPCYTGRPAPTEDVGTCHGGTQTCANGNYGSCNGEVTPVVEFCNGRDEDCNGTVDDDYDVGTACSVGLGICEMNAVTVCTPNGESTQCDALAGVPAPEVCDGLDNDCNGVVDNGVLNACGACGEVPQEICNHIDDDCDGVVDNGFVDADADGWAACAGDCKDADPRVNPGHAEVCDNVDNNCEGHINEGLNPTCICKDQEGDQRPTCETTYARVQDAPQGWAFTILNEGILANDCNDLLQTVYPGLNEVCDRLDNDCNGQVDDGLVCP